MTDHDQRWKTLLREFLEEFFQLFFRNWAELFDFSQVEWLDQEVFPDPPEGRRRALDLPARLPLSATGRSAHGLADAVVSLIHIEVESGDSATSIDERMPRYYFHLRE